VRDGSPSQYQSRDSIRLVNSINNNKDFSVLDASTKRTLISASEKLAVELIKNMVAFDSVENSINLTSEFGGMNYIKILIEIAGSELPNYLESIKLDKLTFLNKLKSLLGDSSSHASANSPATNEASDSDSSEEFDQGLNYLAQNLKGLSRVHSFFLENNDLEHFEFKPEWSKFLYSNTTLVSYTPTVVLVLQKLRFHGKGFNMETFFSHNSDYDVSYNVFYNKGFEEVDLSYFHFDVVKPGYHEYFAAGKSDFKIDFDSDLRELNQIKTVVVEFPYSKSGVIQKKDFIETLSSKENGWQNLNKTSIKFNYDGMIEEKDKTKSNRRKGEATSKSSEGEEVEPTEEKRKNKTGDSLLYEKHEKAKRLQPKLVQSMNENSQRRKRDGTRQDSPEQKEEKAEKKKSVYLATYSISTEVQSNIISRLIVKAEPSDPNTNYDILTLGSFNIYIPSSPNVRTLSSLCAFTIEEGKDFVIHPQVKIVFEEVKMEQLSMSNEVDSFYKKLNITQGKQETNLRQSQKRRVHYSRSDKEKRGLGDKGRYRNTGLSSSFLEEKSKIITSEDYGLLGSKERIGSNINRNGRSENRLNQNKKILTEEIINKGSKDETDERKSIKQENLHTKIHTEGTKEDRMVKKEYSQISVSPSLTTTNTDMSSTNLSSTPPPSTSSTSQTINSSQIKTENPVSNNLESEDKDEDEDEAKADPVNFKDFFQTVNNQAEAYQSVSLLDSLVKNYKTYKEQNDLSQSNLQLKGSLTLLRLPDSVALFNLNFKGKMKMQGGKVLNSIPGLKKTLKVVQPVNMLLSIKVLLTMSELNNMEFRLYMNEENLCDFKLVSKNDYFINMDTVISKRLPVGEYVLELVGLSEKDMLIDMNVFLIGILSICLF